MNNGEWHPETVHANLLRVEEVAIFKLSISNILQLALLITFW